MTDRTLQGLPIEMHLEIASHLDDKSAHYFEVTCRETKTAFAIYNGQFWRKRFEEVFDRKTKIQKRALHAKEWKYMYFIRRRVLKGRYGREDFARGVTSKEKLCIRVLREMILDSYNGDPTFDQYDRTMCCNLQHLRKFVENSNIINNMCLVPSSPKLVHASLNLDLTAIQLVLSPFGIREGAHEHAFGISQKAAYESPASAPIFQGFGYQEVNLEWALHCLNFFKYHMVKKDEHTLHIPYFNMQTELQRPWAFKEKLRGGTHPLGRNWNGTYAYLHRHEIKQIRTSPPGERVFIDKNVDQLNECIQELHLTFGGGTEWSMPDWPQEFERHLQSLRPVPKAKTRAQHRTGPDHNAQSENLRFIGGGYDNEEFFASGWLNPLPPQRGIPGWQRLTMMKFFDLNGPWDQDALWAYEGIVVPGGQIILGRWWCVEENVSAKKAYCGPFILWNTDYHQERHNANADPDTSSEASTTIL